MRTGGWPATVLCHDAVSPYRLRCLLVASQVPAAVKALAHDAVGMVAGPGGGSPWTGMTVGQFAHSGKLNALMAVLGDAVAHCRRVAVVFRFAWAMDIVEAALNAHNQAVVQRNNGNPGAVVTSAASSAAAPPLLPFVRADAFHKQQVSRRHGTRLCAWRSPRLTW